MARGKFNGALHPRNKDGEFARKGGGSGKRRSSGRSSSIKANVNYVPKNRVPTGKHKGPNIQARTGVKTSASVTRADLHNKQPQTTRRMTRLETIGQSTRTGIGTGVAIGVGLGALGTGLAIAGGARVDALSLATGISRNVVQGGLAGGAIGAVIGGFKTPGRKKIKASIAGKRV